MKFSEKSMWLLDIQLYNGCLVGKTSVLPSHLTYPSIHSQFLEEHSKESRVKECSCSRRQTFHCLTREWREGKEQQEISSFLYTIICYMMHVARPRIIIYIANFFSRCQAIQNQRVCMTVLETIVILWISSSN